MVRLVKAFLLGRNKTADIFCTGRLSIPQHQIENVNGLLSENLQIAILELYAEVGLWYQAVWHILKKCLAMRKISSQWVSYRLNDIQK
ncbi:hypothetical protein NPIL_42821 [Nephila pilipes]|uniref:Uncharacterized protein n=1 Tax=Nephila pilipes TaxID=299642 RepID=A0A8X6PL14_NEPPI|nr:hypothetical protein NPIL_42821 [Nephila pilipes]